MISQKTINQEELNNIQGRFYSTLEEIPLTKRQYDDLRYQFDILITLAEKLNNKSN
jgi:hypothetical protein